MGGFQTVVNIVPAPAVEGDFASTGPRHTVLTTGPYQGDGAGLVAGPLGVTVGQFAWVLPDGRTVVSYGVAGAAPTGYVHRENQALIENILGGTFGNTIPPGMPVILHDAGDFFDLLAGGSAATVGSAIYARNSDGAAIGGAAPTGATANGSIGSSFTGATVNLSPTLTVSAVTANTVLSVGDTLATNANIPAGTTILAQVSGTAGGAGVYTMSANATATASAATTSFGTVLNVNAVSAGALTIGDPFTGTNVPAGTSITGQLTGGAGGVGTYSINAAPTQYVAPTALTVVAGVLTKWVAKSVAAVGTLVKISTWGN